MTLEEYILHFRLDPDSERFHDLCEDGEIEIIRQLLAQKREDNRPLLSCNNLSLALIKAVVVNEMVNRP